MTMFNVLRKNSDVAIGAIGGVIAAPFVLPKVATMVDLGQYTGLVWSLGIAAGVLALGGKARPEMAVAFSSVFLAHAIAAVFPQITT